MKEVAAWIFALAIALMIVYLLLRYPIKGGGGEGL